MKKEWKIPIIVFFAELERCTLSLSLSLHLCVCMCLRLVHTMLLPSRTQLVFSLRLSLFVASFSFFLYLPFFSVDVFFSANCVVVVVVGTVGLPIFCSSLNPSLLLPGCHRRGTFCPSFSPVSLYLSLSLSPSLSSARWWLSCTRRFLPHLPVARTRRGF